MALEIWDKIRRKVITVLRQKTAELTNVTKDVRITRAVGAGAGIVGGAMVAAGFILIPFTLTGSFVLSGVGAGIATVGGATSIGATVANSVIENGELKQANQLLTVGNQLSQIMQELLKSLEDEAARLAIQNPGVSEEEWLLGVLRSGETALRVWSVGISGTVVAVQSAALGGTRLTVEGGASAARISAETAVRISIYGGVLNILLLPISIAELSINVHALATEKKTNAIEELERIIDQLEKNMDLIHDYVNGNMSSYKKDYFADCYVRK